MSAKTLCLQHGEKVMFASASFALVSYVAFGMILAREDNDIASIRASLVAARGVLSADTHPDVAPCNRLEEVRSQWVDCPTVQHVPSNWTPYMRPRIVPELFELGCRLVPHFYPPVLEPPSSEVGKVTLRWKGDDRNGVPTARWIVRRRHGADTAWKTLAEPKVDTLTFVDTTVEPETSYEYQVTAVPAEIPIKCEDHGRDSQAFPARTEAIVRLHLFGGTADLAQIGVRKYMNGAWKSSTFPVRPGEPIGGKVSTFPNGPVLDFSTGLTLVSIGEGKRRVAVGQPPREIIVRVMKVTYRDASGAEHDLQ